MADSLVQRREVYYRGHVQGVGFRYTARSIAERHRVTGYVRNLADGRVQLVAEGEPAELDAFLSDVAERLGAYVRDVQTARGPASGGFSGFDIRF